MTRPPQFIVGEVSKNWINGQHVSTPRLLAELFEQLIATNAERGYHLHSFTLHRLMVREDELNETIIAVFEYGGLPILDVAQEPEP